MLSEIRILRVEPILALSLSLSIYIYIYMYIYIHIYSTELDFQMHSFSDYKGLILCSKSQNDFGSRLAKMHHSTKEDISANRAANVQLFTELMRLGSMLESVQNLIQAGKLYIFRH